MQRKPSKNRNGRLANSAERAFQAWTKHQSCVWCGNEGPSIVDHCRGQTWSHNKVHCGHWFVIPQCAECDAEKTIRGKRQGNEAASWAIMVLQYDDLVPNDVWTAINDWNQ